MADDLLSGVLDEIDNGTFDPAKPAPKVDPLLDAAIDDVAVDLNRPIATAKIAARGANPDLYAEHSKLATQYGLPVDLVERNFDTLKVKAQDDMVSSILEKSPAIANWYANGDNTAAIKVDELRHLSGLEWLGAAAVDAFQAGQDNTEFATLANKVMRGVATPDEKARADKMFLENKPRTYGADTWGDKAWSKGIEQIPMLGGFLWQGIKGGAAGFGLGAGAGAGYAVVAGQLGPQVATPEELVTVPAAALAGGIRGGQAGFTAAGYLYSFEQIAGPAYYEFKSIKDENGQPLDDDVAKMAAYVAGAVGGGLEYLGSSKLASIIPGGEKLTGLFSKDAIAQALTVPTVREALKAFAVNSAEGAGTEIATEVAQQAVQIFAGEMGKLYANSGKDGGDFALLTADEITQQLIDTAQQTAQAMTILAPALSGSRLASDLRRANRAQREQSLIGALADHAAGNELNARLPEKAKEAVRAITENGPIQNVYVAPEAFSTYFQSVEEVAAFAEKIGLGQEYAEAAATGRDMEIPIDVYYTSIAGSDIGSALRPYTRLTLDAMNANDAVAFDEAWAEAQASLQEGYQSEFAAEKGAADAETQIFDDVKSKVMDAGIVPDQAAQYAKLYSTFFRVMGERTGNDAAELYQRYGFDVKRALPQETTFQPADNFDLSLDVIRSGKVAGLRKQVAKASGPSLLQAIQAKGGLIDSGGELAALDLPKRFIKKAAAVAGPDILGGAAAPVSMENTLDDMASRLWQDGYFPEFQDRPSTDDLVAAIRAELSGSKRYTVQNTNEMSGEIARAAGLVAFADQLDQFGLDPATMTNEEIRAEIDRLSNDDPNTAALFQFAGPQSQTADIYQLATAKDQIARGANADGVRRDTGWFVGLDGKWRYEISDDDATLNDGDVPNLGAAAREAVGGGEAVALGDLLNHDRLFAAYPDLKIAPVYFKNLGKGMRGWVDTLGSTIWLNPYEFADGDALLSTLLHEVQHMIQRREGFATGGNSDMADNIKKSLDSLALMKAREVSNWLVKHSKDVADESYKTGLSQLVNIYADALRLQNYARSQSPSGQFRHIRNMSQWVYADVMKYGPSGEAGRELVRRLYELPRKSNLKKRNAFLAQYSLDLAQVLMDRIPPNILAEFKSDPRKINSMIAALERDASKARAKIKPLADLQRAQRAAEGLAKNAKFQTGWEVYASLAGEIEARNTQARQNKTDAQRRITPPEMTADRSPEQAIVVFQDGEIDTATMANIDAPAAGGRELFQTAPATETEAFKAWFGDSKVVDADGKPLVVYHGTAASFEAFDNNKAKDGAHFFSSDRDHAAYFGNVGSYYASIQSPMVIDQNYLEDRLTEDQADDGVRPLDLIGEIVAEAKSNGHDGLIINDFADAGTVSTVYLPFDPTQIKSVNNRGTFDPNDARILNQQVGGDTGAKLGGVKRGSIQLAPGRTIINLFDQADLSTFLHESGHFFLEIFKDLATQEIQDGDISADWQATKEYLGIGDDGIISTEAHEKWARTFEAYLFEGKSPSNEIAGIMSRFRSWLVFVYRSVAKLNAPINDKIRGVMDRLVATDEEIKSATQAPEFRPSFNNAADAGMTDAQWKSYQEAAGKAVDAAKRNLDAKMLEDVSREASAEWREVKAKIKQDVTAELSAQPVYQVMTYLRGGNVDGIDPAAPRMKLDREAIISVMGGRPEGEGAVMRLPRTVPPMYRATGGVHPDMVAEVFGFKSGHEMLTAMISVPPLGRAIVDEVGLRMRQHFGDLMGDAVARARAASEALPSEAQAKLLDIELGVLVKKGLVTTKLRKEDAARMARDMVRSKPIREAVRHKLYMNANAKAAADAENAIRAKDWKKAIAAKQRQMLNHYAAMEAVQAQRDADAALAYLNKFTGRKRAKGIAPDYLDQIEAMLERFDLRKSITLTAAQRRLSLAAWIQAQEDMGAIVQIPDALRDDAFRKPFKSMTVDDMMALKDAVKNIEHIGRLKDRLLAAKKAREFESVRDEVVASIAASQAERGAPSTRNPTPLDKAFSTAKSLEASLLKLEQVFAWMDGGDVNGPLRRYVWQPIADAENKENALRVKYAAKFMDILGALDRGRLNERLSVPGVKEAYLRSEIIAVALNMGNEGNLDKMLRGEVWSPQTLDAMTSNLNEQEWQAVQAIWDMINEFWPQVAALQKRLTGVEPPKIDPRPVKTPFGELRGGYYPLIYDPRRAFDVADRGAANADKMFENTYLRPETQHGFTKERTTAYTRPLLFDLDGAGRHIVSVIHDLTHREAIMDAHKILTNGEVRGEIENRYGRETYQQIVPWLQSIAHDAYKADGLQAVDRMLRGIRSRATIMGMGYRITTMVTQLAGYMSSLEMVKVKHMAGAIKDFAVAPFETNEKVNALSETMRFRSQNMDRDIREGLREISGEHGKLQAVRKFAFTGIGIMDRVVTVPTWMAAYRQHLETMPGDTDGAKAFADRVINLSQGSGGPKDLAAVTRSNEKVKLLTMFYSYFSAYYNRQRNWGRDAKRMIESGEYQDLPDLLARQLFMTVGPAVLSRLLVGDGPDDDEGYAEWALKRVALYPTSSIPIIRDAFGVLDKGFSYTFTPAARTIDETLIQPWLLLGDIIDGTAEPRKAVKQTIETTGYALRLPLGQAATSIDNLWLSVEKDGFQLSDLMLTKPKP